MTESFDRAALIGALRRKAEFLRRTVGESESFHVMLTAADALEEAERDLAGYGTRGALAYEREERMVNLRLKIEALKERNMWRARAEDAERRIAAVEALHRPRTIQVLTGDCAAESCDHEEIDDCPLAPFEQCVECDRIADEVSSYYSEGGVSVSTWPCPTVAASTTPTERIIT